MVKCVKCNILYKMELQFIEHGVFRFKHYLKINDFTLIQFLINSIKDGKNKHFKFIIINIPLQLQHNNIVFWS